MIDLLHRSSERVAVVGLTNAILNYLGFGDVGTIKFVAPLITISGADTRHLRRVGALASVLCQKIARNSRCRWVSVGEPLAI